jgi:thiamine biosynthesis lipoprotein ApbE
MLLAVTLVGGSPDVAEGVVAGLGRLLQRWDVTHPGSELDRLRRGHKPTRVDDDTLLLLALTTDAAVDLRVGTARLSGRRQLPARASIVALALDITAEDLRYESVAGFRVAVGADVIALGTAPTSRGWPIATHGGTSADAEIFVHHGGVITARASSRIAPIQSVTVHAATAWTAATLALAALATPVRGAHQLLADAHVHAWLRGRGWVLEVRTQDLPAS